MKKSLLLVLLATLGLSGCVVAPAYDGPYAYYPAPAYVAPSATVVVRPSYYGHRHYYYGYRHRNWR